MTTQTVEDDYRARIGAALARFYENQGQDNWAVPSSAGGANDYDKAVDAFAQVAGVDPAILPDKTRRQWARQLEKVASSQGATLRQLVDAILAKPESRIGWKSWTTPWPAKEDLTFLILQVRSGGVEKVLPSNRQDRNRAIMASWQGQTIDGEVVQRKQLQLPSRIEIL